MRGGLAVSAKWRFIRRTAAALALCASTLFAWEGPAEAAEDRWYVYNFVSAPGYPPECATAFLYFIGNYELRSWLQITSSAYSYGAVCNRTNPNVTQATNGTERRHRS